MITRFQVAGGDEPLTVQFEPVGMQVVVEPGDHIIVEFQGETTGWIQHLPELLAVGGGADHGRVLAWHSDGREIDTGL